MHYAAHVDYAFASVEHIMRKVDMDDFFDTHMQMELQCSSLLFMLTLSVDFTMDHIDLLEFLFEY